MFKVNSGLVGGSQITNKYHIPSYPYFAYFKPESNTQMTKVFVDRIRTYETLSTWMFHQIKPAPLPEVKISHDDVQIGVILKELQKVFTKETLSLNGWFSQLQGKIDDI